MDHRFILPNGTHATAAQVVRGYMTIVEAGRAQHELEDDRDHGLSVSIDVPDNGSALRVLSRTGVPDRFWTFDDRQLKLARAVGLKTR